jgi:hypothetical protein
MRKSSGNRNLASGARRGKSELLMMIKVLNA